MKEIKKLESIADSLNRRLMRTHRYLTYRELEQELTTLAEVRKKIDELQGKTNRLAGDSESSNQRGLW